jgi:hypothetical protein
MLLKSIVLPSLRSTRRAQLFCARTRDVQPICGPEPGGRAQLERFGRELGHGRPLLDRVVLVPDPPADLDRPPVREVAHDQEPAVAARRRPRGAASMQSMIVLVFLVP